MNKVPIRLVPDTVALATLSLQGFLDRGIVHHSSIDLITHIASSLTPQTKQFLEQVPPFIQSREVSLAIMIHLYQKMNDIPAEFEPQAKAVQAAIMETVIEDCLEEKPTHADSGRLLLLAGSATPAHYEWLTKHVNLQNLIEISWTDGITLSRLVEFTHKAPNRDRVLEHWDIDQTMRIFEQSIGKGYRGVELPRLVRCLLYFGEDKGRAHRSLGIELFDELSKGTRTLKVSGDWIARNTSGIFDAHADSSSPLCIAQESKRVEEKLANSVYELCQKYKHTDSVYAAARGWHHRIATTDKTLKQCEAMMMEGWREKRFIATPSGDAIGSTAEFCREADNIALLTDLFTDEQTIERKPHHALALIDAAMRCDDANNSSSGGKGQVTANVIAKLKGSEVTRPLLALGGNTDGCALTRAVTMNKESAVFQEMVFHNSDAESTIQLGLECGAFSEANKQALKVVGAL